jgi:hypothetical protein
MSTSELPDIISNRIGRAARTVRHVCGQVVIEGLDRNRCAFLVAVEPTPLTAEGEVAAMRDGRGTWRIFHGALDPRDRWNIPGHLPGQPHPVHAEHRCHDPLPASWRAPVAAPVTRTAPSTDCEF